MTDGKTENGMLIVKGNGQGLELRRQNGSTQSVKAKQFADDAKTLLESYRKGKPQQLSVTFELIGGQPQNICFNAPSTQSSKPTGAAGHGGNVHQPPHTPDFHNPYNFVPAVPRQKVSGELGDHQPVGHQKFHADRFSGVIHVKLTPHTPVLLPDAARAVDVGQDHKSYPVRVDAKGRPYIPPTSIKGMLRSAYEAVTNSRLAVFGGTEASESQNATGHGSRLAFRRPAQVEVVPVRIEEVAAQSLSIRFLKSLWMKSPAKLPRYLERARDARKGEQEAALRYPDKSFPAQGDHVWVKVDQKGRVSTIEKASARKGQFDELEGWVLITEPNFSSKRNERVFVVSEKDQIQNYHASEATRLQHLWTELIEDYQRTHVKDLKQRKDRHQKPTDYLGDSPGQTAWSRQVWDSEYAKLKTGTLCYARMQGGKIIGLYPVAISRDLFAASPLSLLDASLRPATAMSELSPAERVFGWVNQRGQGAYRGNLRVTPVVCESSDAIESFGVPGVPLAILGQPKPQQSRFYVAQTSTGEAQKPGRSKEEAGYSPGKGLRGRKVYPHHRNLPAGYWKDATTDRTQQASNGHFQEYRRPDSDKVRDNQNRSMQGWVKEGIAFTFDLHVTNLSRVELGALLWLLSLPDEHYHRLGGGKPLGFGSVRLEIASSQLHDGHGWKEFYTTLEDITPPAADHAELIREFQEAVRTSYGSPTSFDEVSFVAAYLKMATGHADTRPTHYPRARQLGQGGLVPPHPEGLAYEWFVTNERESKNNNGPKVSLGDLANDPGLPLLGAS